MHMHAPGGPQRPARHSAAGAQRRRRRLALPLPPQQRRPAVAPSCAGSAVSSVFVDAGSASTTAASEAEQQQHWSGTPKLGPSGATIGVVCAVVVVLLVIATLVHWLHRSGRLPCCNKLLDDTADGEDWDRSAVFPLQAGWLACLALAGHVLPCGGQLAGTG